MSSIAMIVVMNFKFDEVRDRDYFFVTAYNIWAVAMGLGVVGMLSIVKQKAVKYALIGLLLFYPIFNLMSQFNKHDRRGEFIALDYGLNILNSLEENAIVFTNGDNDTFPPWYAQAVKDKHAFWHLYQARDVYPTERTQKLISDALKWKKSHINGVRQDVTVANLSLMNTPWYLKQLRDMEGVELNWTDDQISKLAYQRLQRDIDLVITSPNGERFTVKFPAQSIFRVKDFAVAQVVRDNFGKRPIYFAITCSDYTFMDDHLINEGMVSRIVSTKGENRIDPERLQNNLDNVYSYRGIFNEKLYKDDNMTAMVMNYGASFLRLAEHFQILGEMDKAVNYYEQGMNFILDPENRSKYNGMLCVFYGSVGRFDLINAILQPLIEKDPNQINNYIIGALAMFRGGAFDEGFSYIEQGFQIDSSNRHMLSLLIQSAVEHNLRKQANQIIDKYLPDSELKPALMEMIADTTLTLDDF